LATETGAGGGAAPATGGWAAVFGIETTPVAQRARAPPTMATIVRLINNVDFFFIRYSSVMLK
jgi:hypothetical protein